MSKVILITGASSGIGLATAKLFLDKGYIVLAATGEPKKAQALEIYANALHKRNLLHVYELDVNSDASVQKTIEKIAETFLSIDILVNNAGFGFAGAVEDFAIDEAKAQFETNFFGVHRMIKAVLPIMRTQKSGTIVNISSMGGKVTFPFFAMYNASKHALESYTEGLWMELTQIGIRVYMVEPGLIETNFYSSHMKFPLNYEKSQSVYKFLYEKYVGSSDKMAGSGRSDPSVVARKIFQVVESNSSTLRHPVGKYAGLILWARWILPDWIFLPIIAKIRG